ncbi:MAG: hypothetical protein AAFV45_10975 [Pseudomonadota bacterium]
MRDLNLEPGQILLFRTTAATDKQPLWSGQMRLKSGVTHNVDLWKREYPDKETGELKQYLGGNTRPVEDNPNVYAVLGESKGDIALFDAENKADDDGRPDLRGPVTPAGEAKHYVSIWKKPGKNGTFLAGQVQTQADIDALKVGDVDEPDVA